MRSGEGHAYVHGWRDGYRWLECGEAWGVEVRCIKAERREA